MEAGRFIELLIGQIDELYADDIISGARDSEILLFSEHTYLINVAIYLTVQSYNKESKSKLSIVPEKGGRTPTDFALNNENGETELLIEHENGFRRIAKNYLKLAEKLANDFLLICYVRKKNKIQKTLNEIKNVKAENSIKKTMHILIAAKSDSDYFESAKDYVHELI